jgi:hypothetical protein
VSITVSELIEEIQDQIPAEKLPSLFPALNRAIKTIAKKLYLLESDLLLGELAVPLFASIDYTASTIAFASGGNETADIITDSASGFAAEGFQADMPIETDSATSANIGPHRIASVAAATLNLDARESVLTTEAAGSSITITSVADFGYMPDDFWGFVGEEPYIDGYTWTLKPLPNQLTALAYTSAGTPNWYKLKNNRLYVYPATSADITIKGDYWKKPQMLSAMNDYIPWNEQFDDAISEYLSRVLIAGVAASDESLHVFLNESVALITSKRSRKAPNVMPGGINYDLY